MEELNGFQTKGYIKLYRNIFDNPLWLAEPLTKAQAWVDLILLANYKDGIIIVKNGTIVNVLRGQCGYSIKALSARWKWSHGKVERFIKYLKNEKMINQKITENHSIITILKYEDYQSSEQTVEQIGQQTGEQIDPQIVNQTSEQTVEQTTTNNKDNKVKKDNKVNKEKKNFIAKSFFQKLIAEDEEIKKYSSLKDLFIEFLEYKTQIKKQFKTENSVRNAFLDFVRLSNNDVNLGRLLVDNSIARGWQSIYDLSAEQRRAYNAEKQKNHQIQDENYGSF